MEKELPANAPDWQENIDLRLAQRLNRSRTPTGVTDHQMAEKIFRRVQRMTQILPVHEALLRRYQPVDNPGPHLPVVFVQTKTINQESVQDSVDRIQPESGERTKQGIPEGTTQTQLRSVKVQLSSSRSTAGAQNTLPGSHPETMQSIAQTVLQRKDAPPQVQQRLARVEKTAATSSLRDTPQPGKVYKDEAASMPVNLPASGLPDLPKVDLPSTVTVSQSMNPQPASPLNKQGEASIPQAVTNQSQPHIQRKDGRELPVIRGEVQTAPNTIQIVQTKVQTLRASSAGAAPLEHAIIQGNATRPSVLLSTSQNRENMPEPLPLPQVQAQLVFTRQAAGTPLNTVQRSAVLPPRDASPVTEDASLNPVIRRVEVDEPEPLNENHSEIDVDDLADKVMRKLAVIMRVERERRGWLK